MGLVIFGICAATAVRDNLAAQKRTVVFTNGCFDLLHRGHIDLLERARALGDFLIVGLNSDFSVQSLKGEGRPLVPWNDRAFLLSRLISVDMVVPFVEETPLKIIERLLPDVLVKGSDWKIENIVGRKIVEENGGKVITLPLTEGLSTTNLIQTVLSRFQT